MYIMQHPCQNWVEILKINRERKTVTWTPPRPPEPAAHGAVTCVFGETETHQSANQYGWTTELDPSSGAFPLEILWFSWEQAF